MINDDLALRDLSEVADAIAAGRITSVQATEACLARIAACRAHQRLPAPP